MKIYDSQLAHCLSIDNDEGHTENRDPENTFYFKALEKCKSPADKKLSYDAQCLKDLELNGILHTPISTTPKVKSPRERRCHIRNNLCIVNAVFLCTLGVYLFLFMVVLPFLFITNRLPACISVIN